MEVKDNWGYIAIDTTDYVNALNFPKSIDGMPLKTGEFHISLIKLPADISDELHKKVHDLAEENKSLILSNQPRLTGKFLRVIDARRDRETIIGLANVPNLKEWQEIIREVLPNADFSIPHITLYKRTDPIGLNSQKDFQEMASALPTSIEGTLKSAITG